MNKVWIILLVLIALVGTYNCISPKTAEKIDKGVATGEDILNSSIAKGIGDVIPWGGTAISALLGLFAMYRKYRSNKKVIALIEGIEDVKVSVSAALEGYKEDKKLPTFADIEKLINDALRLKAIAYEVYPEIKADVNKLKELANSLKGNE